MNILITGAAGFIGSFLCEKLIGQHHVFGLDNFCDFYSPEIKKQNIKNLISESNFQLLVADIRNISVLERIFTKYQFDMVIHLAAMAGVRPSIEDPQLYTNVNVNGTLNLLEQCKQNKVKNFIFASSSSIYGNNKKVPFSESDNVDYPISPYAATKKAGELLCHTYFHLANMSIICLRFFTVYGPRQRPDLAIIKFARKMLRGESIPIYGDGSSQRDYTYIDDIIDGIMKALDYVQTGHLYEIFNLGESRTIKLDYMIEVLEKYLDIKAIREYLPMQPGDVNITYSDLEKSKKILGYDPQTEFEDGIRKFIDWLKLNKVYS